MAAIADTIDGAPQRPDAELVQKRRARPAFAKRRLLTAGELIAMLQHADPAAPVVIRGQYGGFDYVHAVAEQPLRLNVNRQYGFGPHDQPDDGERADIVALAIECSAERVAE